MEVEERPYTIEEAQNADEAFITSATMFVNGVVEIPRCTSINFAPVISNAWIFRRIFTTDGGRVIRRRIIGND